MTAVRCAAVAALLVAASVGCRGGEVATAGRAPLGPEAIGTAMCHACGMVVREQPAPRGQLVRRDGAREHYCSIDDLLQSVKEPSPHGEAVEVYVETTDPGLDPADLATAERPWAPADAVTYVVGVSRGGVMGPPVLTYSGASEAAAVAARSGGQVRDWNALSSRGAR